MEGDVTDAVLPVAAAKASVSLAQHDNNLSSR